MSQVITVRSTFRIDFAVAQGSRRRHTSLACSLAGGMLMLSFLLLAACQSTPSPADEVALPLDDTMPAAWEALRDVTAVNIDGDDATEYLLLFTYDAFGTATTRTFLSSSSQTLGPIGAIIYDAQVGTGTTTTADVSPDKAANALVPYAILPSYRRGAGQGFLAPPNQRANIQAYPVSYRGLTQLEAVADDTLVFLAGDANSETYLTFIWWQNRTDGYGVTQLYAPGGFETAPLQAFNWSQWRQNPQPIRQLIAVHPLHDRNLLCRRFQYAWDESAQSAGVDATQAAPVLYRKTDAGLQFCYGIPDHPFYPEGVVLAYLLEGDTALLDPTMTTSATQDDVLGGLRQLIQDQAGVRVDDLASYATLAAGLASPTQQIEPGTMGVCAVITVQTAATIRQTALYFTLRHEEPQVQIHTPDQLFITNVEAIPAPNPGVMLNCQEVLGG